MMSKSSVGEPRTACRRKGGPAALHLGTDLRRDVALGTLAMSVVHDLRNPLGAIHGGAEMLTSSELTAEQVRRLARNIYSASVRIQELLREYVAQGRTRNSQPRQSNLCSLVEDAVAGIAAAAEAQSVVVLQNIPADLVITVDPARIGSVLTNLLANALEAMPGGGSIHVSAITAEGQVVIRVVDTGPGVPLEIRGRLFQPFVTARKPNGWGLGLSQARRIVNDHCGEMWLESIPGKGACFAFSLA
jgi:signal transduction histidine kinase